MNNFTPKATCQNRFIGILNFTKRSDEETSRLSLCALAKPLANQGRKVGHKSHEYGKNKKTAFTLAEVLITLAIIGIVAALTIPNLITNYRKKQTVVKLQKAISVLNQAYRQSYDELGSPEDNLAITGKDYFNNYWAPYLSGATLCNTCSACGYSYLPFTTLSGAASTVVCATTNRAPFYLKDGVWVMLMLGGGASNELLSLNYLYVDLNGSTPPNKHGIDVFFLTRTEKGILPYGYDLPDNVVLNNCSEKGAGEYCAERIRREGWQINYPFKK
jgi:prepilin-type N-terminal cleavage/methylation domain-containing protein